MNKSEAINELATALAKAQGEMRHAIKNSANPFFKSGYADLGACWDAVRGPFTKHGLSIVQLTDTTASGELTLITTLVHSSGQWLSGVYPVIPAKRDPQGYGSAITYARRYALSAITGLASEDDDGSAASRPTTTTDERDDRDSRQQPKQQALTKPRIVGTSPQQEGGADYQEEIRYDLEATAPLPPAPKDFNQIYKIPTPMCTGEFGGFDNVYFDKMPPKRLEEVIGAVVKKRKTATTPNARAWLEAIEKRAGSLLIPILTNAK